MRDERAALVGSPELGDRSGRYLGDEVLVLPARDGPGRGAGDLGVDHPRLGDDPAERSAGPQVTGQRPRIDAGDGRDPRPPEERCELSSIVEDGSRGVGDDEGPQPRPGALVVVDEAAVVADKRVRHDDDLAGVGRIGADLLVAGLARIDDEVTAAGGGGTERDAGEDRPVLEGQERRTVIADPWIDEGGRGRPGDADHAGRCGGNGSIRTHRQR